AGPACIQVWDHPWDGEGDPGTATHLGSVDWSYDTPVRHYVTIYRAMVTAAGVETGESTLSVLQAVMNLTGIDVDGARITMPSPPVRSVPRPEASAPGRRAGSARPRSGGRGRAAGPRGRTAGGCGTRARTPSARRHGPAAPRARAAGRR